MTPLPLSVEGNVTTLPPLLGGNKALLWLLYSSYYSYPPLLWGVVVPPATGRAGEWVGNKAALCLPKLSFFEGQSSTLTNLKHWIPDKISLLGSVLSSACYTLLCSGGLISLLFNDLPSIDILWSDIIAAIYITFQKRNPFLLPKFPHLKNMILTTFSVFRVFISGIVELQSIQYTFV